MYGALLHYQKIGNIIYIDHVAVKYLFTKKDAKPRLIRWILLLQEFDMEIEDKKGSRNVVADYMSRLDQKVKEDTNTPIKEIFPDEFILSVEAQLPWYANFVNSLVSGVMPLDLAFPQRKKLLHDIKSYLWNDSSLYKRCAYSIIRRYVPHEEVPDILMHCYLSLCGGHLVLTCIAAKVLQSSFYWPSIFKDCYAFV